MDSLTYTYPHTCFLRSLKKKIREAGPRRRLVASSNTNNNNNNKKKKKEKQTEKKKLAANVANDVNRGSNRQQTCVSVDA